MHPIHVAINATIVMDHSNEMEVIPIRAVLSMEASEMMQFHAEKCYMTTSCISCTLVFRLIICALHASTANCLHGLWLVGVLL